MTGSNRIKGYRKEYIWGYCFLLPFLAFYLIFNLYPMVQGFIISLHRWNITGERTYIGFQNYINLTKDQNFWKALTNTLLYVLFSTPIFMAGSLFFALLVDSKLLRGKTFARAVFFLPNILAVSIIAIIWLNVLQPYVGLMDSFTKSLGIARDIFWLGDVKLVWVSITMVTFWWNTGYYMLLYLAGLQEIPDEFYEAASIDGATGLQRVFKITFPLLKRTHLMIMFLQVVASFRIFGQVYLITGGGPGGASRTLIQYVFETGFQTFILGRASAASFVLMAIILIVSVVQLRFMRKVND